MKIFMPFSQWLRRRFEERRSISRQNILHLAGEINDLIRVASEVRSEDHEFLQRLDSIQEKIDLLRDLTRQKAFSRLPVSRRRELRDGLLSSRDSLVEAIQHSPPPTNILQ